MMSKLKHALGPVAAALVLGAALWVLHREISHYHYRDIVQSMREIPPWRLVAAVALTVLNYWILTGYDLLALAYLRQKLPYRQVAIASFLSFVSSYNLGALLGGTTVRYRVYSALGLSPLDIVKMVLMCGLTFTLGWCALAGTTFTFELSPIPTSLHLSLTNVRPLGLLLLATVLALLLMTWLRKAPIRVAGWELQLPSWRMAMVQTAISALDLAVAAAVLYVLLPPGAAHSYPWFVGTFLLAQGAGLLSHVPGGLGVFEAVLVVLLGAKDSAAVFGSIMLFRVLYYFIPFTLGCCILAAREAAAHHAHFKRAAELTGQWAPQILPRLLAALMLLAGWILLISGATPPAAGRLAWLSKVAPLGLVELSHFAASLVGLWLMILAQGLLRRLDAAYWLTCLLLVLGMVLSILKGADVEEALVLGVMLLVLLPCRRYFDRRASLFSETFSPAWWFALLLVVAGSLWLGHFSHRHVDYLHEMWWRFALDQDAPRVLRASAAVMVTALAIAGYSLMRPSPPGPHPPTDAELADATAIVRASKRTMANLALVGDKSFLFSQNRQALIMYGVEGRSWVSMGDPMGAESEVRELVWTFRELSERHGGWTVFYQVGLTNLHHYLDLGLSLLKIGEEARVPLSSFSLEGRERRALRHTQHRLAREGCQFELIPAEEVPQHLSQFREISDAWLADKSTREKGFSLGRFDEKYLARFPAAVIRQNGRLIAFANVFMGAEREELSVDLMRYRQDAPASTMEFLFLELMAWGHTAGYQWFNMGMAPLSGLENRPLAPLWNRIGGIIYRHGEHFYNFEGLRSYKEKFDPQWVPKYLASSGGLALPRILANVASLISGGLSGVLVK